MRRNPMRPDELPPDVREEFRKSGFSFISRLILFVKLRPDDTHQFPYGGDPRRKYYCRRCNYNVVLIPVEIRGKRMHFGDCIVCGRVYWHDYQPPTRRD